MHPHWSCLFFILLRRGQRPIPLHLQPRLDESVPRCYTSIILDRGEGDILTHSPLASIPKPIKCSLSTSTLDRFTCDPDSIFPILGPARYI